LITSEKVDLITCTMHICGPKMYVLEIFIGTEDLQSIFACICRQQFTTHWWGWLSGAPTAWHHWCRCSQKSTGSNWIQRECSSSETNIFNCTPENFLSK